MMADLRCIQQDGLVLKLIFAPKVVLDNVYHLASLATDRPLHFCWPHTHMFSCVT